jgi:Domain of unknown function (DUF4190)
MIAAPSGRPCDTLSDRSRHAILWGPPDGVRSTPLRCLKWAHMSRPVRGETSHAPRNEFGVASLILGLVALITCWMLIGVPFGIAAVITGDIGRGRVKRGEANNPRTAMAGMVLGGVAIVAGLVAIGYWAWLDSQ